METNANGSPKTAQEYLETIFSAAKKGNYFPSDWERRRRMNESLLKDVGYGLSIYSDEEINDVVPTIYSSLIVVNSFNHTGVTLDAVECNDLVRAGIEKGRQADGQE